MLFNLFNLFIYFPSLFCIRCTFDTFARPVVKRSNWDEDKTHKDVRKDRRGTSKAVNSASTAGRFAAGQRFSSGAVRSGEEGLIFIYGGKNLRLWETNKEKYELEAHPFPKCINRTLIHVLGSSLQKWLAATPSTITSLKLRGTLFVNILYHLCRCLMYRTLSSLILCYYFK